MNRGTEKFNETLIANSYHYRDSHPHMIPFVGKHWGEPPYKKLLVVGESHYLPEDSLLETIKNWYELTTGELEVDEKKYTNTAEIIDTTLYKPKGHSIYRNIDYAILNTGFKPSGSDGKSWPYIAYMNFFQRPASKSGGSINPNKNDIKIANDTLTSNIEILKPDFIFFTSAKAWGYLHKDWFADWISNKRIGHSAHPGMPYTWCKPSKRYSVDGITPLTAKAAFEDFIIRNKIFTENQPQSLGPARKPGG